MADLPLALVVHDLKNALGALEGRLWQMSQASEAAPSQNQVLEARRAHGECAALRHRLVQFLTIYSAEHGLRARCEDESPADTLTRLATQANQGNLPGDSVPALEVVTDLGHAPPYGYYDRRLVHMALEAALHNAQRFARQRITLGAYDDAGQLVFFIDDDGPGLGATDPSKLSTGLGMHLCQAIAQAHHCQGRQGQASLQDKEGEGARFTLRLP